MRHICPLGGPQTCAWLLGAAWASSHQDGAAPLPTRLAGTFVCFDLPWSWSYCRRAQKNLAPKRRAARRADQGRAPRCPGDGPRLRPSSSTSSWRWQFRPTLRSPPTRGCWRRPGARGRGRCWAAASWRSHSGRAGPGHPGDRAWAAAVTWHPPASGPEQVRRERHPDRVLVGSGPGVRRAGDVDDQVVITGTAGAAYLSGLLALRRGRSCPLQCTRFGRSPRNVARRCDRPRPSSARRHGGAPRSTDRDPHRRRHAPAVVGRGLTASP